MIDQTSKPLIDTDAHARREYEAQMASEARLPNEFLSADEIRARCPQCGTINPLIDTLERQLAEKDAQLTATREALEHEVWCRTCAEEGCANCNDCTASAVLGRKAAEEKP